MILVLTASVCYSEEHLIIDTLIPTPINYLRNAMRMRDSCLVMREELDTAKSKLSALEEALKKSYIITQKQDSLDMVNRRIIRNLDAQMGKKEVEVQVLNSANSGLKQKIKNQNWIIRVAGAVILGLTAATIKN